MNGSNSLVHKRWNYKYHIVFAPKYRRKVFYKEKKRKEVGKILRELCEWKGVKIVEAEACSDYIHMLFGDTTEDSDIKFNGISKKKKQYDAT